jgi:hypothetical protein
VPIVASDCENDGTDDLAIGLYGEGIGKLGDAGEWHSSIDG